MKASCYIIKTFLFLIMVTLKLFGFQNSKALHSLSVEVSLRRGGFRMAACFQGSHSAPEERAPRSAAAQFRKVHPALRVLSLASCFSPCLALSGPGLRTGAAALWVDTGQAARRERKPE